MTYRIDPELVPYLAFLPTPDPDEVIVDYPAARARVTEMVKATLVADTTGLRIDDTVVPGQPDVPVRVYVPEAKAAVTGGVLYIHGGGFTMGSIEMEHANSAKLARELGAVVVSVEYRLAPEDPFPAGIEDCYAALAWFHAQAEGFGVDPARIAICGSSAGGGLAAGLALYARDHGGPAICFQYLGIPELDHRLDTPSMLAFVDTPMWSRPQAVKSWALYLGEHAGEVSPYASPSIATDLSGLPPTYISTMEFDPLRDEGIHYTLALMEAGVTVELHSFPGTFHGASGFASEVTKREREEQITVLRRAIA